MSNEVFTPPADQVNIYGQPRTIYLRGGLWITFSEEEDGATAGDRWYFDARTFRTYLTYYQAMLKNPQGKMHWLLYIDGPGEPFMIADADLRIHYQSIWGVPVYWAGQLNVSGNPAISCDPYSSGVASVGNVSVEVMPRRTDILGSDSEVRFQDRPLANGYNWAVANVHLLRWAEGLPFLQAQPIISGKIDNFSVKGDGICTFDIEDFSVFYDFMMPPAIIDSDNWAAASDDAAGQGYPILYGAFSQIDVPEVDPANDYCILAGNDISVLTAAFIDGVEDESADITSQVDDLGRPFTRLEFSTDIGDGKPTATGHGPVDDEFGTYTGTGSLLVKHPASIITHMGIHVGRIPSEIIEVGAFKNLLYPLNGWEYTVNISADESRGYIEVCGTLARWMRSVVFFSGPQMTIRRLNFLAAPVIDLDSTNIIEVVSIVDPGIKDIYNDITISYMYLYNTRWDGFRFTKSLVRDESNDVKMKQSQILYGRKSLRLQTKEINDTKTARHALSLLAELTYKPRMRMTITCTQETNMVMLYDIVRVTEPLGPSTDGGGFVEKRFAVTGIQYGLGENTFDLLEV